VVSGGYELGDLEADTDNSEDDRESFHVGVNIGFSGFTVGGSYGEDNQGLAGSQDLSGWDVGVTYSTGPWGVGATWFHGETELAAGGNDEVDLAEIGANYALGPGITIMGALQYYDEDNNVATNTDGIAFSIGSKLSF
jgi:predicted porin